MDLFEGIFYSTASVISVGTFLLCIGVSLLIGAFLTWVYMFRSNYTKSFVVTLFMLPAMVCVVIMMVNGNVGAGVAVAGAFSLVRFRSATGTAREIGMIFLAMASGLITGMGYLGYAVLFALTIGLVMVALTLAGFGNHRKPSRDKTLKMTVPEELDYSTAFEEIFREYTSYSENVSVKTSGKDKSYKLNYSITLKDSSREKEFIDALRQAAGHGEISLSRREISGNEL